MHFPLFAFYMYVIRFNQHAAIILSINILPASIEYIETRSETRFRILTRATGFPGAHSHMLLLTVISTLFIYSLDYLEKV